MGIKVNRYSLLAHIYFFFNSVWLPFGMLYTHLLMPFFYGWLLFKKKQPILFPFLIFLIPFDLIHLWLGVDLKSFLVSNALFVSTYIFVCSSSWFVNHYQGMHKLFRQLLYSNTMLILLAIGLYFTPYKPLMWYINKFTHGVDHFYRLSMFTYEASYYALLFTPLAFYFLLRISAGMEKKSPLLILLMTIVPLLLSLSLGVLGAMLLAYMALYMLQHREVLRSKRLAYPLMLVMLLAILGFVLLLIFFPDNPIFIRLKNIFIGVDTSANGRTSESFTMAYRVASLKSAFFGAGLGQIKILAVDVVRLYYSYWGKLEVVRIPNAMAETLAIFGIAGVIIRLLLIGYFFFKTRVWTNQYRFLLFVFVFIYQFTGSFIINIVEYMIWILAFSQVFPEFNVKKTLHD